MNYLIRTVETYRFPDEATATTFIEEQKKNKQFEVTKCITTKKELKQKGEVIDTWIRVDITKVFNEEKEPCNVISINYESE